MQLDNGEVMRLFSHMSFFNEFGYLTAPDNETSACAEFPRVPLVNVKPPRVG